MRFCGGSSEVFLGRRERLMVNRHVAGFWYKRKPSHFKCRSTCLICWQLGWWDGAGVGKLRGNCRDYPMHNYSAFKAEKLRGKSGERFVGPSTAAQFIAFYNLWCARLHTATISVFRFKCAFHEHYYTVAVWCCAHKMTQTQLPIKCT